MSLIQRPEDEAVQSQNLSPRRGLRVNSRLGQVLCSKSTTPQMTERGCTVTRRTEASNFEVVNEL